MATTSFKPNALPGRPYGSFAGRGVTTFPQILYMLLELTSSNMTTPTPTKAD